MCKTIKRRDPPQSSDINKIDVRFAVQTLLRPQSEEFVDYRGYAGRIASGIYRKGDEVAVLPAGFLLRSN